MVCFTDQELSGEWHQIHSVKLSPCLLSSRVAVLSEIQQTERKHMIFDWLLTFKKIISILARRGWNDALEEVTKKLPQFFCIPIKEVNILIHIYTAPVHYWEFFKMKVFNRTDTHMTHLIFYWQRNSSESLHRVKSCSGTEEEWTGTVDAGYIFGNYKIQTCCEMAIVVAS